MEDRFPSGELTLACHIARPVTHGAARGGRFGVVLCPGFPSRPNAAPQAAQRYPAFADRIAGETGFVVMTFNYRGTGLSDGEFSMRGWLDDLRAAVDHLAAVPDVTAVWLAGLDVGGSLAICAAADDQRIRGVVSMAAPADFSDWASDPRRFLDHARGVGVIRSKNFPANIDAWAREIRETRPLAAAPKITPRPFLVVHGSADDRVSLADARALVDAAGGAELKVVHGAGHRLRHDPRAVALLLGWLDRQELS